jgi:predicted AAA+ superfamily ATPase
VLLELLRRKMEVSYLRTASGYEVDFVAFSPDGAVLLIQACADLSDSATHAREVRALLDAASQFPNASLHIIMLETTPPPDAHPAIQYHNAAAWLLGKS